MTLIELIVVAVIALIALGTVLLLYTVAVSRTEETAARNDTLGDVRGALERISRDVREGRTVTVGSGGSSLTIDTPLERITYACSAGTCTRSTATLGGSLTDGPDQLVTGLDASTAVFSNATIAGAGHNTYRVTLTSTPEDRDRPIVLTEDITLRNQCLTYTLLSACT
jgi:type II secretory pathway pseudopilin PulG